MNLQHVSPQARQLSLTTPGSSRCLRRLRGRSSLWCCCPRSRSRDRPPLSAAGNPEAGQPYQQPRLDVKHGGDPVQVGAQRCRRTAGNKGDRGREPRVTAPTLCRLPHLARTGDGGTLALDPPHSLWVEHHFPTGRTLKESKLLDRVLVALELARPVPADRTNSITTT